MPNVNAPIFDAGTEIDGVTLGEWLEDSGDLSRYEVTASDFNEDGDSIWICNNCEHIEDECSCDDEYDDPDVDELTEWADFDPDC